MTPPPSENVAVRRTFLFAFLVLFVPSKYFALAHDINLARLAGETLSTLLVWWCLYRLCMRATRQAWFTAMSIPALYIATFWAPAYAWVTLVVLFAVQSFVAWYFPPPDRVEMPDHESQMDDEAKEGVAGAEPTGIRATYDIVDLDSICTSYRRILLALRIIRAGTASVANSALLVGPLMLYFALYDGKSSVSGLIAGLAMAIVLGLSTVLFFAWLRALWRGSIKAARITATVAYALAAISALMGIATVDRQLLVTGGIWFHLTAFAVQVGLFTALGIGSATLLRRRNDEALISLLRENATYTWRESLQQLAGIVPPRGRSLKALSHRSVVLSLLAFAMEGAAFYVYFDFSETLLEASDGARMGKLSPFPGPTTILEGHYLSLVTIAALMLPFMYVMTQLVLALAEGLRRTARRASLRPAEDVLKDDHRHPVLFLRDFTDDQVALDRAALPGWVHAVDPGSAQANLEDVMQAYGSVGPVVAIGRPGDEKPPVGAARQYLQDTEWKGAVLSLMDSAALIVFGVSDSGGVVWEIDQARDRGHLAKSVFVLPPTKRRSHLLTRQLVRQLLSPADPIAAEAIAAPLLRIIRSRRVAGLVVRDGTVRLYVTDRRPSQVEFDVTLRLSRPSTTGVAAGIDHSRIAAAIIP